MKTNILAFFFKKSYDVNILYESTNNFLINRNYLKIFESLFSNGSKFSANIKIQMITQRNSNVST